MIFTISIMSFLQLVLGNISKIDLNICKMTHLGTEYIGKVSKTETNVTCLYWNSATQEEAKSLVDEAFPDGSKILARNYCRNPNGNPQGPWCYTAQEKLISSTCDVPLCKSSECRVSGTGMEYIGDVDKSSGGKKCTKWTDKHKLTKKQKETSFKNRFFADGLNGARSSKCRNPDGNISGPWCYVEKEDGLHDKELCDVPFCDDVDILMYSEGSYFGQYFFFTSINTSESLNISFRLWNPSDWLGGQIHLLLSVYDISADSHDIERWNSGVEILLSHSGTGIWSKNEDTFEKMPFILSGVNWTDLFVTWVKIENSSLLVQVFEKSKIKPIAVGEILTQNTIFEQDTFRYFSLGGSPSVWNVKSRDEDCFVHTISQMNFTRFWLVKKTTIGKDIEIFVRAKQEAVLIMRPSPMVNNSQLQVIIGAKDKIKVLTQTDSSNLHLVKETLWPNILDFWKWQYFKITLLRDKLQVFWVREASTELVIEASHENIEKILWVTFASPWVSYWTIYCDPRGIADPPPAVPPECVYREGEPFNGTLSVTKKGKQCLPWTDKIAIPEKYQNEDLFQLYGGIVNSQNFCRNLDNDPKGAYCFVRDLNSDTGFGLEHCYPRSCFSGDCKIAGTDNDYIGHINKTRSKRECKPWAEVTDEVVKINNFPDPSLEDAGNYCRNPSKSVTGSWCFTTDSKVPRDLCFIKDCDKPLQCTVLTSGYTEGTYIYIFPSWRKFGLKFSLKAWNPDIYEGLIISLLSRDNTKVYKLLIGDEDNEKVKLLYAFGGSETLLLQKTLPHLIPTGKWGGYWLKSGLGKVELGYHGVSNSFFEWKTLNENFSFKPMFINFGTIKNHWIGINFECTECLVEKISIKSSNKIYPINIWRSEQIITSLLLNLRGTGSVYVTLMWTPDFKKYLEIQILSKEPKIFIIQYMEENPNILASYPVSSTLSENEWSTYIISFTEGSLIVHKDSSVLLEWLSPFPLLFYWFAISVEGGTINWSANCQPPDIDGEPRNGNWGKWGPWSCSVTCGKGEGRIERVCNDPQPNIFGEDCEGSSTYEGPCNDFPCGKISPGTQNMIRQYLSSHYKSFEVDSDEKVVLTCNPEAVLAISQEVSEVNITWTHNGFPYSRIKFHMDENNSLVIPHAQEKHNGIYLCIAYQEGSIPSKVVLEVISLVVIRSKPTKKVRKGRSMTLKCNGLALSYVYADLSQRWELNGTMWKDYGIGTLQAFTADKLENITDSHAGVWTCVVAQEDFKFKWTTNWIYLKVKSAPSFWSHLMEDVATAPLFGKLGSEKNAMILFFALAGILLAIILGTTVLLVKLLKKK